MTLMRQSELFTRTRREAPKDEVSRNAQLLIRGGFIHKEMAGVYDYLPLGLRVFSKIVNIVREEMNAIGGQEIVMSTLQDPALWGKTNRWSDEAVDIWFKSKLKGGGEIGLAWTHEEPLTNLMKNHIASYQDLPRYIYQFQTKLRNEPRAKSGIMRTREFVMKDLYSYSRSEEEFREFYERSAVAYMKVFKRAGLGELTYRCFASGGSFGKFSDEFQTVCEAGEDIIYIDEKKHIAVNKEVYNDEVLAELGLNKAKLREAKAVEVGNIFPLGTKYSDALGLTFKDEDGKQVPVVMGSYGIGPGRLMGTLVEVHSDEKGIVWPEAIAPFKIHLVSLGTEDAVVRAADGLYETLTKAGVEVLYDDRDLRAGEKFADADLIGIPYRAVVSAKTVSGKKVELTERKGGKVRMIAIEELLAL